MATGIIKRNADLSTVKEITEHTGTNIEGFQIDFTNNDNIRLYVGRLDASNNYLQFLVNGVDKGYIKFTVSRNV